MGSLQVRALKGFDRTLGRAAYRSLLASCQRRGVVRSVTSAPPEPDQVRRVLVIRPGGIGDAVLFYPMLFALRDAWPNVTIEVLAERRNAGVFLANDVVARVYAYDRAMSGDLIRALKGRYDVVVDTEQYHYLSALVAYLTRAPVRCGFDTRGRGGLFTHRVPYDDQTYEVLCFLRLAHAVTGRNVAFDPDVSFFPVREGLLEEARSKYSLFRGSGTVVIQPGASMIQKRWEPEKFRAVANWVAARGLRTVLLGGPQDSQFAREIAADLPTDRVINLCPLPLPQTAAVVALSDLYVGSDTGVMHIAYGVGTPTVHLFGPGAIEKWAPRGSRYQAISKKLPCSPCIRYNYVPPCPYDVECMKMISVNEVIEAISRVTGA